MTENEYWTECIAKAAEEHGIILTRGCLQVLATAAAEGHENYGMTFYPLSPGDKKDLIIDTVATALKKAFILGQLYWSETENTNTNKNRRAADGTYSQFEALVSETTAKAIKK